MQLVAPVLVGAHVTLENIFQFYWTPEKQDSVETTVLDPAGIAIADKVPMQWPEFKQWFGGGFLSIADRVDQLVRNCHLKPVYEKDQTRVIFQRIPFREKTWEKWKGLTLPKGASLSISFG